jgi:O-antigen ligase
VNVYLKKGVVDARDRLRKEAQVRRHARLHRLVARLLAVMGGGAGPVWTGAAARGALLLLALLLAIFVAWFWRGVSPPPQPSPYVLAGKLAVAIPAAVAAWALAVRDTFRRTR